MFRILFQPEEKAVEANPDESILGAALRAGIPHSHICGGKCRCSTCRVLILEGTEHCSERSPGEQAIAERMSFEPRVRLACQVRVAGDAKVRRLVLDHTDIELTSLVIEGEKPGLAGIEKPVVILFADIRGFTAFADTLLPYDVIHVLNRYFRQMDRIVLRHGGYIDSYIGDGLMALFEGDDPKDAALRAVHAGLEMQAAVSRFRPYLQQIFKKSFGIGIGVHYGVVVAGTVGSSASRKKTVIGGAVNLASRIESSTKETNASFLISAGTHSLVADKIQVGRTFQLPMKGIQGLQTVHEVIGLVE
jgi:adenylate cyclase